MPEAENSTKGRPLITGQREGLSQPINTQTRTIPRIRIESLTQSLNSRADGTTLLDGVVFSLGFEKRFDLTIREVLHSEGFSGETVSASISQIESLPEQTDQTDLLILNVDEFEDVEDSVDALLHLRRKRPDIIVIVVSSALLVDDLSSERRMICDVSLRAPLGASRLRNGLRAAIDNNHMFRLRELPPEIRTLT